MQPLWEQKEREGVIQGIKLAIQQGYIQQGNTMDEAAITKQADCFVAGS
jgi:hypothetical protein